MRNKTFYLFKMITAFLGAILLANTICYFLHSPAIQVDNPDLYTTLKHKPGDHNPHSAGEGFGNTTIDSNGFNNDISFDYSDARILCVGSSQTEAQNVYTNKNYVSLLNARHPEMRAYNLGVSASTFRKAFFRIPALKEYFPNAKIICFEINSMPTVDDLRYLNNLMSKDEVIPEDISWKSGNRFKQFISSVPLCRLLWQQTNHKLENLNKNDKVLPLQHTHIDGEYYQLLTSVISHAKRQAGDSQIVIFTLDFLKLKSDGTSEICEDNGEREAFGKVCASQEIVFITTAEAFKRMYSEEHRLPNGFLDSPLGTGHLNEYGHQAIANILEPVFNQEEMLK